ncbi:MAG: hypothetical protein KDC05_16175 [Bacteroidales bacterium]|nr:hypothetical protein [Bacteroidales bacterium]
MKKVKIYGQQNSGTIYLEWLIKRNLDVELDESPELGWKHRLAPEKDEIPDQHRESTLFICLVKNPYSWLLSMHKRPYFHESLKKLSFTDFTRFSFGDYRNPVVMWNKKIGSFVELGDYVNHHTMVRYEDLLTDIAGSLNNLTEKFGIPKPTIYKDIKNLLTNSHGIKTQKFHRDFYLEEKWKKALRPQHLENINGFLDKDLMHTLNYEIL